MDVGGELEFVVCVVCMVYVYTVFGVCMEGVDEVDHGDQVVS